MHNTRFLQKWLQSGCHPDREKGIKSGKYLNIVCTHGNMTRSNVLLHEHFSMRLFKVNDPNWLKKK